MKKSIYIFIALSLLILPVSGYDLLDTWQYDATTTGSGGFTNQILFANASFIHNITRITGENIKVTRSVPGITSITIDEPFQFTTGYDDCNNGGRLQGTLSVEHDSDVLQSLSLDIIITNSTPPTEIRAACLAPNLHLVNHTALSAYFTQKTVSYAIANWQHTNPYRWGVNAAAFGNNSILKTYGGAAQSNVVVDFNATPTSGMSPQYITLTDTTTGGPSTTWNWSGTGPGTMFWGSTNTQNSSVYLATQGNYSITHCAEGPLNSECITKTDLIWIHGNNETVTTQFIAIDAVSGYSINNASMRLQDIENASWTNTTTGAMGKATITTLSDHTINAYASALGFKDNDLLAKPAMAAPYGYTIMMQPVGYYNVSAGWVTLYVSVFDADTGIDIQGATVCAGNNGMCQLWQTTNAAGVATFPVENKTDYVVRASADSLGYQASSTTLNTGTGSGGDATVTVNIGLSKKTVTPTIAPTTGPGGTVPVTVDPYTALSSAGKQSALADEALAYGPMLVQLFILLTIVGGIRLIAK